MSKKPRIELFILKCLGATYILSALIAGNVAANQYSSLVTKFFHQQETKIINNDDGGKKNTEDYKLDYNSVEELEKDERAYAEEVQSEGVILLQNKNLPLQGCKTTLLGLYSRDDKLSGGVSVSSNAPKMADKFKEAGFDINQTMVDYYKTLDAETDPAEFSSKAISSIQNYNDLAVVVLFSGGAEGVDITANDLRFSDTEKTLISYASKNFKNVVVLLNTSNTVELGYLEQFNNLSTLYINFAGDAGIGSVPKIINGTINPSGKTADTFAYNVESPISMLNYENSSSDQAIIGGDGKKAGNYVNYIEGIYVGYRYFETRYEDVVLGNANTGSFDYKSLVQYPFGYGLSYTTFDYSNFDCQESGSSFKLSVKVTNTGKVDGKEAVGFYMQSPYTDYDKENGIEKASVQLVEFGKTSTLKAGESETISVEVSKKEMRAYDETKAKTYIVDDGKYYFTAASDSHKAINNILMAKNNEGDVKVNASLMSGNGDATLVGSYNQKTFDNTTYAIGKDGKTITNQFADVNMNYYYEGSTTYVSRKNWVGTIPAEKAGDIQATDKLLADFNPTYDTDGQEAPTLNESNGLSLASMIGIDYDNEYWDKLLNQMSAEELMSLVAHGGFQTEAVSSINKPASTDKDGPAGLDASQLGGDTCYTFPSDSMFACTWNKELIGKYGYYISQDCLITGTTGWYAPACNIHRVAICGRTREYFSEDPYLSGAMSYVISSSAQKNGVVTYVKHFALNEQENNRSNVCTFSNEQAIREIYLKPFEMAVAEGGSMGVMTSMNRVGTVYSSSKRSLCTDVLKNEWGFKGVVITDFVSGASSKVVALEMIMAGTDLFLCTASGTGLYVADYATNNAVLNQLRDSAHRICYAYANSNLMNGLSSSSIIVKVTPAWKYFMIAADAIIVYALYLWVLSPILFKKDKKEGENDK